MRLNEILELIEKGELTDIRELEGTATLGLTNTSALVICVIDETVFYQYYGETRDKIKTTELEYFTYSDEIGDILNLDEEEFEDRYDGFVAGFKIGDELYLLDEFIRDNYCI